MFVITKVENTVPRTYVINDLNGEEIAGTFYEKVIKTKHNKLYVKWKDYDGPFSSWINKKGIA